MWSSAVFEPWMAVRAADQLVSGCPSSWTANHMASFDVDWLLHITPILSPWKAMTAELSSTVTSVAVTGSWNGVPQTWSSPPTVRLT